MTLPVPSHKDVVLETPVKGIYDIVGLRVCNSCHFVAAVKSPQAKHFIDARKYAMAEHLPDS